MYVLADQEDINCSQIKIVKIRHGCHAFSASVHTGIELFPSSARFVSIFAHLSYHDSLALVLKDVT